MLLHENLAAIQTDLRLQYSALIEASHHGRPVLVERIHSGRPGRPSIHIDPSFLQWAYSMRSVSSISRFLGVSRTVVRQALLDYGIAEPQQAPFAWTGDDEQGSDLLLDPAPMAHQGTIKRCVVTSY